MKIQKFQSGLDPEIRHEVKVFELTTLSATIHKAKVIERSRIECGKRSSKTNLYLGKRPASSYYSKSSGQGSGWHDKGKKPKYSKSSAQQVSTEEKPKSEGVTCR